MSGFHSFSKPFFNLKKNCQYSEANIFESPITHSLNDTLAYIFQDFSNENKTDEFYTFFNKFCELFLSVNAFMKKQNKIAFIKTNSKMENLTQNTIQAWEEFLEKINILFDEENSDFLNFLSKESNIEKEQIIEILKENKLETHLNPEKTVNFLKNDYFFSVLTIAEILEKLTEGDLNNILYPLYSNSNELIYHILNPSAIAISFFNYRLTRTKKIKFK